MARYLFCVLCIVLLAVGCGKETQEAAIEKKIEGATGGEAEVDISKGGMKVTGETEEGEYSVTAGEETEIPEDFPSDVFIYSPSKAVMAMRLPEGCSVSLTTRADMADVVDAYKREMEARGWSEEGSMKMGDHSMLVYEKDGRAANVNIIPSDDEVQINLTVSTE